MADYPSARFLSTLEMACSLPEPGETFTLELRQKLIDRAAELTPKPAGAKQPIQMRFVPRFFRQVAGMKMQPRMRLVTPVLIVFLALLMLTTVAYAVYRLVGDPGLQSVQDAGLVTDLNVTAQPTVLPTQTPASTPQPASNPAISQTLEGVTLTLDWVYLDEGRLAMGMKFSALPADVTLGAPQVTFRNVTPAQAQGYSQSIRSDDYQAVYVSYQVIHSNTVGGKVSLGVDVPLVRSSDEAQSNLANYHFEVKDVPVFAGQSLNIDQTYAVQRNGVEVRLKSVRVMPSTTEVVACYDFPAGEAPFWYMQHATVQIGDGPEESYRRYQVLSEIQDDHCVKLGFAVGNAVGETRLTFRVHRLVVPLTMQDVVSAERIAAANQELAKEGIEIEPAPADQSEGPGGWQFVRKPDSGTDPTKDPNLLVLQALEESLDGPWEFHVNLPSEKIIPGQAEPKPTATPAALGEQTIEGVTMSLDWVFADAKRIAFGYTFTGLPDVPEALYLSGNLMVKDQQGNVIGTGPGGMLQRVAGQPGAVTGSWSNLMREPLEQNEITFSIDLTLDGSSFATDGGVDINNMIGEFPLPEDATPYPPGVFPPALPDRLVGTFHFDVHTPVYPMQVIEPKQAVEANGVLVRLEQAELTPSYARFTLCYQKPSPKDWMIGGMATLQAGATQAQISSYSLLADVDFGGYLGKSPKPTDIPEVGASERCVQIDFLLGHADPAQSLTLTIPALEQSMPEVVADSEMKAAQEKLKAEGIEVDYSTSSFAGGGGGGGPIFSKLPEGMDQHEAYQRYMNALGYVYAGPWVFTLELQ